MSQKTQTHSGSVPRVWVSELCAHTFLIKLYPAGTPTIASRHTDVPRHAGCGTLV